MMMSPPASKKQIPQLAADLSLLFVALSWGSTFIVVKTAIADLPPFPFIALRFLLASLTLLPFLWIQRKHINKKAIGKGFLVGVFLFLGYMTQTIGLQYTTASNAGFITGLNVVIVPLLVALHQKRFPPQAIIWGTVCAAIGLAFLSIGDNLSINSGDPIVLICAFCFAAQIFFTGRFAPDVNATVLTTFQLLTVTLLSGLSALILPQPTMTFTPYVWFGLILTALACTSLAFFIQTKMQQFTSESHTAIILSAEPVFSAVFAYLLAGELLSTRGYFGAALVLGGILISELGNLRKSSDAKSEAT